MKIDPRNCDHIPENSRVYKNSTFCKKCKIVIEPNYQTGVKRWLPVMSSLHPHSFLISLKEKYERQKKRERK